MPKPYSERSYANGQRLLVAPMPSTRSVTALVLYRVGSRYETDRNNGVSHFVEHLMFKGTKRRPTTLDLSKELDRFGAEYNAFTSKDYTGYYVKISAGKIERALDILSDMLHASTFRQEEIDRERNVVVEEISMYEDNPLLHIDEVFEHVLFGPGTPLGRLIAGPRKNIRGISRDAILAYRDRHYVPSNRLVVLAGHMPPRVGSMVQRYFPGTGRRLAQPRMLRKPIPAAGPRFLLQHKKAEQAQLCLGFPAYPYGHPRLDALRVLTVILGGNMSSRLFISIRERRGLAYSIRASADQYNDAGVTYVQAGVHHERITEALRAILEELEKAKQHGVTAEELANAKEYLAGTVTLELEDSQHVAWWYGRQRLIAGTAVTPEERLTAIRRVTARDVQRVANDLFVRRRLAAAIIGPYEDRSAFLKLLRTSPD